MSNNLGYIELKSDLESSICYREHYESILENQSNSFESPLLKEVGEIFNAIFSEYKDLTKFQLTVLTKLINEFNNINILIDPNRLKDFNHFMNYDDELCLYRRSEKGITNLVIHEDEDITYSFIGEDKSNILDFFNLDSDFEFIAYHFFSN